MTYDEAVAQLTPHPASFTVPEQVEFTNDALPRNPAGTILKSFLKDDGKTPFFEDTF